MTISDPFWRRDTEMEPACGFSDFEVTCYNNTPVLRSFMTSGYGFAMMSINYEQRSMHVVDVGKLELLSNNCLPIWNTSAKLGVHFRIASDYLNLILYRCTQAAAATVIHRDRELVQTRMRCGNKSEVFVRAGGRYNEMSSYDSYEGCDAAVMPVLGSSGKANAGDYEQLIVNGFLLTWKSP
uniref:Wall-associated receptor kinase galacturonan-binding domain-containing protein n=1 Tax=Triticum urartu TaxID=4572 RepID=A0A8R7R8B2_TRIUA